jgi:hypothetical protein
MSGLRDELAALADEHQAHNFGYYGGCTLCRTRDAYDTIRALLDRFPPEAEGEAVRQIRLMENLYGVRQVWCVVYDSPTPNMDGTHPPLRMADQDYDLAMRNYEFVERRERVAPKRNLRIETRWVSDYSPALAASPEEQDR